MNKLSDEAFNATQRIETEIRGRYLRFGAMVEGLLAKCVLILNEVKTKRKGKEEKINFKQFMFNQKLIKIESLLREIYPDLVTPNTIKLFSDLDMFKGLRNKMAHCYFTWDENDLKSVTIWDLDDSGNIHEMQPTTYSVQRISDDLTNAHVNIIGGFNLLATEIIQRGQLEVPHIFVT